MSEVEDDPAVLPTGTVTFLMTDIEGSTRAWQAAPEGLTASIVAHYDLLGGEIARHGGHRPEEQGEGDSVVAVFTDAADALATAVAAQRRLRAELPSLAVRMALHTGEAILRDERNYVGLTIIRCARIRSSGYGGQILVSEATAAATAEQLPDGASLVDLGRYGLRGLSGREHIWQLVHADLPRDFPPLKAGASAAGNLPDRISRFVGRRAELAAVSDLVDRHRLVTLTGPAGVGKSRLALAVAEGTANSFPGGAWWIPIPDRGTGSPGSVADLVASACSSDRTGDAFDDVVAHVRSIADSLFVIDGADRWRTAVAGFVDDLLARCPDTRVLVTARQPLTLPGEQVRPVGPLPLPDDDSTLDDLARTDAGALFLDRFGASGASVTDRDAAAIVAVCRRLGGAPGPIEMAASRSAAISIERVAARIDDLVGSADRPGGQLPPSWGLHLVDDAARRVLERLTLFRAPFAPDAAMAIATGDGIESAEVVRSLRDLVDQHVLEPLGDLLQIPERIRQEAEPNSRSARGPAARHAAWFAHRAEEFEAAGLELPTSWIADEMVDIVAALEHAREHDPKLAYRLVRAIGPRWHEVHRDDARRALGETASWIAGRSPSDGEVAWTAAVSRLSFATADDPVSPVRALDDEALAIAELDRDDVSAAYLRYRPAVEATAVGDLSLGTRLVDDALALGIAPVAVAIARHLAAIHERDDRPEPAAALHRRIVAIPGAAGFTAPIRPPARTGDPVDPAMSPRTGTR